MAVKGFLTMIGDFIIISHDLGKGKGHEASLVNR